MKVHFSKLVECDFLNSPFKMLPLLIIFITLLILSHIPNAYGDTTNVMIVLDGSGSMAGLIGNRTKMDIAKDAIIDVIKTLPKNVRLGLRVYGHQSHRFRHDCLDSKLEVPLDFVNLERFAEILRWVRPRGFTPLAYSLAQVENDFIYNGRNVVITVTDGIETCDGDPCAVADSLSSKDVSVVFHVVGFDVGETDREVLFCIPRNSGGQYFSANDTRELQQALKDVFELSINPGYLKLDFEAVKEKGDVVNGKIYTNDKHYTFQNVDTEHFTALPPGEYSITRFGIKSDFDYTPYCPEDVTLDSVVVRSGEYKTLPLDELAVVSSQYVFPEQDSQLVWVSFSDHNPRHIVPDHPISSTTEYFLLRPGDYNFTCSLKSHGHIHSVSINNQTLLPQSYNELVFDMTVKSGIPRWPFLILIVPLFYLIRHLLKIRGSSELSSIEEFAKFPDRFKGSAVTLELRLSAKDRTWGKLVPFWTFYPVELTVYIFVPPQFRDLSKFDVHRKIYVTFQCRDGKLDSGNVLLAFKKGQKV